MRQLWKKGKCTLQCDLWGVTWHNPLRIEAASTDLVRAGRGMVTLRPQVTLETWRLGEDVRRVYQEHKAAHARSIEQL